LSFTNAVVVSTLVFLLFNFSTNIFFDPIFSFKPGKLDLKVRLIRIWKVTGLENNYACNSLEMILLDAHVCFLLYLWLSLFYLLHWLLMLNEIFFCTW